MMSDLTSKAVIEAAGGIVVRDTPEGLLVAVIYRTRYGGEWCLPKGKRESGETWPDTALREVREETGFEVVITGVAGANAYLADGVPKIVFYWRMSPVDEDPVFKPNAEVPHLEWLAPAQAQRRLTHRGDKKLIAELHEGANARMPGGGSSMIRAATAWLVAQTIPIAQCLAWRRLGSTIAAYRKEFQGRAAQNAVLAKGSQDIEDALEVAQSAYDNGQIDLGWKLFFVAQRLELEYLDDDERSAMAIMLRNEAEKLNEWRKKTVVDLLTVDKGQPVPKPNIFRAALIRDEHFNNQAYKDGLRRGGALRLAIVLLAVLIGIFYLGNLGYLQEVVTNAAMTDTQSLFKRLMCVAVFGLLGATRPASPRW
jgi:8-oxo-dGTP pyrophosphatase MutT (NUDIX family)